MPMGLWEEGHRKLRKMQEPQEMRALIYYLSLFHRSSHIATALLHRLRFDAASDS